MSFSVSAALLDACVLGALAREPTYGYDLTQKIGNTLAVSESTLYPVLRRLLKEGMLLSFDVAFDGRNRRYYQITEQGQGLLADSQTQWQTYRANIEQLLMGVSV